MDAADVVAIVTVAATVMTVGVSLFSLQVARTAERTAENADRHEHMPVLVCPSKGGGRIAVHNVGRGPYQWVDHAIAALTYTDALGQPYTTLLSKNGTQVFKDMAIPRPSFADMGYAKRLPDVEAGT